MQKVVKNSSLTSFIWLYAHSFSRQTNTSNSVPSHSNNIGCKLKFCKFIWKFIRSNSLVILYCRSIHLVVNKVTQQLSIPFFCRNGIPRYVQWKRGTRTDFKVSWSSSGSFENNQTSATVIKKKNNNIKKRNNNIFKVNPLTPRSNLLFSLLSTILFL